MYVFMLPGHWMGQDGRATFRDPGAAHLSAAFDVGGGPSAEQFL